ncbi:SDR family oxidoreductase [Paralimibaculum aggregatum]|uniref:SDR family oxidoreductase n=1 Tax=Paralimibaculum aggregatum TaxID=3036245 RepID=A0ABQ6LQJ4_9RHOB|nr:SDR family oxidoreductase [Limibaculum sp. NKW23]GMG83189.1 SDR family oxidoreductase [Limibaculum sp. NKW23]
MAQTILITGANRGIGLALARQAHARGDSVIATARRPGEAEALNALTRRSGDITVVGADVTSPEQLAGIAAAEKRPIDLVVCNAGQYHARGALDDPAYTAEAWSGTLMTNVAGVFFTVRAFLPNLLAASAGRVAVISSIMGSSARAKGNAYIYRASKAAATNLACNLAAELAPQGIAVGAYHPGWVRTDMGGAAADVAAEDSAKGLLARFDALGLQSTGTVEDFEGNPIPF